MVPFRNPVVSALTASALSVLGYVIWIQVSRDGPGQDGNDARQASRSHAVASQSVAAREGASTSPGLVVTFRAGLLTAQVRGASLRDVLAAITRSSGVTFVPDGDEGERLWVDLGPRPVRDVVSELLERASYGYAFVDSPGGAAGPMRVFLTKRESVGDVAARMPARPLAPGFPVPGLTDDHAPPPDEKALAQQRAVDALFDACKSQACDAS